MHLAVIESDDSFNENRIESPYHYKSSEIIVAFVNPYTKDEFNDELQFVMELLNEADAEFVDGGTIGCDGNRRVSARIQDNDGRATIKIHDPTKTIEILAGWATGQNSVRLTPKLVLEPRKEPVASEVAEEAKEGADEDEVKIVEPAEKKPDEVHEIKDGRLLEVPDNAAEKNSGSTINEKPKEENGNNDERAEGRKMGHMKQKETPPDVEKEENTNEKVEKKTPEKIKVRTKKDFIDTAKNLKKTRAMHAADAVHSDARIGEAVGEEGNDDRVASSSEDEEELEPIKHRNSILNTNAKNSKNAKVSEETRRKQLEQQMQENFPEQDYLDRLDMSSHFFACAFFVFSIGSILIMVGRRREKGRRDL
jgi:hypothetical protein